MKTSLKGSLQDLKKLSKQLSKVQAQQRKAEKAAIEQRQRIEMAVTDEDRKLFLASVRGAKRLSDINRIESSAPLISEREAAMFKHKRAQAEGRDLLTPQRQHDTRGASSQALPAHAQVASNQKQAQSKAVAPSYDDNSFLRNPDAGDLLKKLTRGQWPVEASLDLHGSTQDEAAERFDRFMQTCIEHQVRCICIIHGQGYGSRNNKPVLKDSVRSWLKDLPAVSAFIQAPENIGGAGAVLVLLRSQ